MSEIFEQFLQFLAIYTGLVQHDNKLTVRKHSTSGMTLQQIVLLSFP